MTTKRLGRGQGINFTQTKIDRLIYKGEGLKRVWSTNLAGFHVNVYPSGSKTYYLRYTSHDKKQKFVRIADAKVLPLDEALEQARLQKEELLRGGDPQANIERGWTTTR